MLTHLIVGNSKGFGGVHRMPLAPLTFLVGANSTGKSSLLQALLVLRQSWRNDDDLPVDLRTQGELASLGRAGNVVHGHRPSRVELGFGFDGGGVSFVYDTGSHDWERGLPLATRLTGMRWGAPEAPGPSADLDVRYEDQELHLVATAISNDGEPALPLEPVDDQSERGEVELILAEGVWTPEAPVGFESVGRVLERARRLHLDNAARARDATERLEGLLRQGDER